MGLIPITYRWDKYVFRKDPSLETVPRSEPPRPVGKGKNIRPLLERQKSPQGQRSEEDQYLTDLSLPKSWLQNYRQRRTLWRPRQASSVVPHPSKVLFLSSPGIHLSPPPLLQAFTDRYGCHLKIESLADQSERPVEEALKKIAMGPYDLVVLDRNNPEWTGAVMKEMAEPALVLSLTHQETHFPKKILVPVDGTSFSYPALSQAIILGEDFGAEIQIFEVSEKKDVALGTLIERMAWKNLNHGFFKAGGKVPQAIAEFAEAEGAELILMGTHGVSPGTTQLPPSVTLEVMRLSPLPTWVLHPEH